jgi:hypothetical protein
LTLFILLPTYGGDFYLNVAVVVVLQWYVVELSIEKRSELFCSSSSSSFHQTVYLFDSFFVHIFASPQAEGSFGSGRGTWR